MSTLQTLLQTGDLPDNFDALDSLATELLSARRYLKSALAILVSTARRDYFTSDVASWVAWAGERLQLSGSELHHLRQVGDMLLAIRSADTKSFSRVYGCDWHKLRSLARLEVSLLSGFLSHYDVQTLSRDAVADAVRNYLGEAAPETSAAQLAVAPDLPGFEAILETLRQMPAAGYREAIRDDQQAIHALRGGVGLVSAAIAHAGSTAGAPDRRILQAAKQALLAEISEIDNYLSGTCATPETNGTCATQE